MLSWSMDGRVLVVENCLFSIQFIRCSRTFMLDDSEAEVLQDKLRQPAISVLWTLDLKSAGEMGTSQDTVLLWRRAPHVPHNFFNQKISTIFSLSTHLPQSNRKEYCLNVCDF